MPETTRNRDAPDSRLKKLVRSLVSSRPVGWIANLPPITWIARAVGRSVAERQIEAPVEEAVADRVAAVELEATLQQIVHDVVTALGYAGAMVATYEQGDSLPVRAF